VSGPRERTGALVHLRREEFQEMLARAGEQDPGATVKDDTPFYRAVAEASAQAITEGLRATGWKLRPAAKLLGISPTRLRYELKEFLERAIARSRGNVAEAAQALGIPGEVLEKKAADLGIESVLKEAKP
jgi:DNA-binding NtrC family response regulator